MKYGSYIRYETVLEYREFFGFVNLSLSDNCLYGVILGTDDLYAFEGTTVAELALDFQRVVDEYIKDHPEFAAESGSTEDAPRPEVRLVTASSDEKQRDIEVELPPRDPDAELPRRITELELHTKTFVRRDEFYKALASIRVEMFKQFTAEAWKTGLLMLAGLLLAALVLLSGCTDGRGSPQPSPSICQPSDPQCEVYRRRLPSPMPW